MQCISPLTIVHASERHIVPCGKCNFCLDNRRNDWCFRLGVELKHSYTAHFVTLTYDELSVPVSDVDLPTLCKRDLQLFFKKLRKKQAALSGVKLRYFMAGEYGPSTERPHYHAIIFNLVVPFEFLQLSWSNGFCHSGQVTGASIRYVTKYIINRYDVDYKGREPPFVLMSRKPGIGNHYVKTHFNYHKSGLKNYTRSNGFFGRLPRYYKTKIFTEFERSRIAIAAARSAEKSYNDLVERLSVSYSDPYGYIDQLRDQAHSKISSKSKEKMTL